MSSAASSRAEDIVVRRGGPDDAADFCRILDPIISGRRHSMLEATFSEREERRFLRDLPQPHDVHVAELGGAVVGFQVVEPLMPGVPTFAHVATTGIWVDLERRRRGVGSALSQASCAAAARLGYEKIFTDVRADNEDSLAFHLAMGYVVVGTARRHVRIDGNDIDVVFIEKPLVWEGA
jgi:ribosomal protein S18 acetylase RimI-like enzyme